MSRKICIYCGKRKNAKSFARHIGHKDNLDSRCRKCVKQHTKIRNKLRKKAPQKPDGCECCFCSPDKWHLDHDHVYHTFRGWLCETCNIGIGKLGDNLEGIVAALKYLSVRSKVEDQAVLNHIIQGVVFSLNHLLEKRRNDA
jgi:hypothetical protein